MNKLAFDLTPHDSLGIMRNLLRSPQPGERLQGTSYAEGHEAVRR